MITSIYHFKKKEHLLLSVNRGKLKVIGETPIEKIPYRWNSQRIKEI
jgi:hypothetical protein